MKIVQWMNLPIDVLLADDDRMSRFIGWWQRMHHGRRARLVAVAVKAVRWPPAGTSRARYLFEVCLWREARGARWHFVCWDIDGTGVWWRPFTSRRAAVSYYRQPPERVMGQPVSLAADVQPVAAL